MMEVALGSDHQFQQLSVILRSLPIGDIMDSYEL